jgi:hypothetical protein
MDISKVFSEYIEKEENYRIAYDIVRRNSRGKIWLIGGALSRNLNRLVYGTPQHSFDFDFVVEESADEIKLPEGWEIKKNKFGNPKFVKDKMEIDFIPIKTVESLIDRNLDPTIENVLLGVPFTIQALAYDTKEKKIIGNIGIEAFEKKVFEVNDLKQAKVLANKKGVELDELILRKADSMGFRAITSDRATV